MVRRLSTRTPVCDSTVSSFVANREADAGTASGLVKAGDAVDAVAIAQGECCVAQLGGAQDFRVPERLAPLPCRDCCFSTAYPPELVPDAWCALPERVAAAARVCGTVLRQWF